MSRQTTQLSYIEAMDALLGYVGKRVQVIVGSADGKPPLVAAMRGVLRQGEPDNLTKMFMPTVERSDQLSYFALEAEHGHGLYVIRSYFAAAWTEMEPDALVIRQGNVETRISL